MYIGPAVVETFGEPDFEPANKKEALQLDKRQIKLDREMNMKYSGITYTYIKSDETSFTIIAYPVPTIGEHFERREEHSRIAARKIVSAVSRGKQRVAANEITAAIEAN